MFVIFEHGVTRDTDSLDISVEINPRKCIIFPNFIVANVCSIILCRKPELWFDEPWLPGRMIRLQLMCILSWAGDDARSDTIRYLH